jgi:hypothetical protein
LMTDDGSGPIIIEGSLSNDAIVSHEYIVSEVDTDVVATLVWADPAATPVPLSLDPPDLMLVNDLDLRIERDGITYEPWVLYPESPASAAGRGDNFRDNVEQVIVTGGGTGIYTIQVSHKNGLLGDESQDYSLIISERAPPLAGSVLLIDEDFSGGLPADWSVSTESGVSWEIKVPMEADSRYDNLSGGAGNFAMVDNNYINESYTGLISPLLDLSDNTAVVLRFNSYFIFDEFESINVEVSTDGGASWLNAWRFQGFNPFPTPYVIDLTDGLAGEANARFRFWWSSEGTLSGDLWQVDDISLEVFGGELPSQSEMCSGGAVDVQDHTFTGEVNCTASVSLNLNENVIIAAGAEVRISAPTVSLGPGLSVESGALFSVSFEP